MSACHDQANFFARYAKDMYKVNSVARKNERVIPLATSTLVPEVGR